MVPSVLTSDLSFLVKPVSRETLCGEFLRYSEVYDQIREARRQEDDNLPQGVWKTELKKADWDRVVYLCQDALQNRTKDLQIAAWLTEAWLHLEGMDGLARGIELILILSRNFWEDIHPQMNNMRYELRLVPYEWLNTRLSEECQSIVINVPPEKTTPSYCLLDLYEAQRHERVGKKSLSQEPPQNTEHHKLFVSIDQTPSVFYQHMHERCLHSLQLIADLEEELQLHLEERAPTFYRLREKIEKVQRFANHVLNTRGEKKEQKEKKKGEIKEMPLSSTSKKSFAVSIESREQAYSILKEVAYYLEHIEPHSPTPYLIRRAIAWGGMSLPQVLADALANRKDFSLFLDILNIENSQKASHDDGLSVLVDR